MVQEQNRLTLWQDKVETAVEISGDGPPLLYLHGPLRARPRFRHQARDHAQGPCAGHPGTSSGTANAAHAIDSFWDLAVYYRELMDRLRAEGRADRRQFLRRLRRGRPHRHFFALPQEKDAHIASIATFVWKHRIQRATPTLIFWGQEDGIISPVYAQEFGARIADSRVQFNDGGAHLLYLELGEEAAEMVRGFIGR